MPPPRFHGLFIAATAAAVLLFRLGGPALWDDDEPKNAACSVAMLEANDWIVPTFNGRLRIEKPPLVNWIQMAGFAVCGRNETGARLGSALLTIGTCLLTRQIGCTLLGPTVGLLSGLTMATCVWTAVGGRAATPDAPLVFFTTLALLLLVRGGFVLPLTAAAIFTAWQRRSCPEIGWTAALRSLRPLTITAAAALVALPWYGLVCLRTDGAWLHGFLLVHNMGRFTSAMEGHSGSLWYYSGVLAVGLFPWSIVLAAMLAHAAAILWSPVADARRKPLALLACWTIVWVGGFSCSGTKLPGYIWPAYPALAIATGLFLTDWADNRVGFLRWCRDPDRAGALVMRAAWSILAATGLAITVGLPLAAARFAPGGEWLGALGLIPLVAAAAAWHGQSVGRHPPHRRCEQSLKPQAIPTESHHADPPSACHRSRRLHSESRRRDRGHAVLGRG